MKANGKNESEIFEDLALFGGPSKQNYRNCASISHKAKDCKNKLQQKDGSNGKSQNDAYFTYCCKSGHLKRNHFESE
jgi:hypothetical protein